MTLEEALALEKGSLVKHRDDWSTLSPARKVTKVWANEDRTIVRIQVKSVTSGNWSDATDWELP